MSRKEFILPVGVAALVLSVAALVRRPLSRTDLLDNADAHRYMSMTEHGLRPCVELPFCWRIAVPSVGRVLPLSTSVGYQLVTYLSLFLAGVLVYVFSRRVGARPLTGAICIVLFLTIPWARLYFLEIVWMTDPMLWVVIAAGAILVVDDKWRELLLLVAFGVLVRETALALAFLYFGVRSRSMIDRQVIVLVAAITAAGVAVIALVRIAIPATEGLTASDGWDQFSSRMLRRLWPPDSGALKEMRRLIGGAWGVPLLLLAGAGACLRPKLAIRLLPFLAACYFQTLIAGNIERSLVLAFPAFIWLASISIEFISGNRSRWAPVGSGTSSRADRLSLEAPGCQL